MLAKYTKEIKDGVMEPQRSQSKFIYTQNKFPLKNIAQKIISCAIEVHSILGLGFFDSVYPV